MALPIKKLITLFHHAQFVRVSLCYGLLGITCAYTMLLFFEIICTLKVGVGNGAPGFPRGNPSATPPVIGIPAVGPVDPDMPDMNNPNNPPRTNPPTPAITVLAAHDAINCSTICWFGSGINPSSRFPHFGGRQVAGVYLHYKTTKYPEGNST